MVKVLLDDPRVNPNVRGLRGHTPLHLAVDARHTNVVRCFLTHRNKKWAKEQMHKNQKSHKRQKSRNGCLYGQRTRTKCTVDHPGVEFQISELKVADAQEGYGNVSTSPQTTLQRNTAHAEQIGHDAWVGRTFINKTERLRNVPKITMEEVQKDCERFVRNERSLAYSSRTSANQDHKEGSVATKPGDKHCAEKHVSVRETPNENDPSESSRQDEVTIVEEKLKVSSPPTVDTTVASLVHPDSPGTHSPNALDTDSENNVFAANTSRTDGGDNTSACAMVDDEKQSNPNVIDSNHEFGGQALLHYNTEFEMMKSPFTDPNTQSSALSQSSTSRDAESEKTIDSHSKSSTLAGKQETLSLRNVEIDDSVPHLSPYDVSSVPIGYTEKSGCNDSRRLSRESSVEEQQHSTKNFATNELLKTTETMSRSSLSFSTSTSVGPCIDVQQITSSIQANDMPSSSTSFPRNFVDLNLYDDGCTPLHSAVMRSFVEIAKLLINHPNVDVNAKTRSNGNTALQLAIRTLMQSFVL